MVAETFETLAEILGPEGSKVEALFSLRGSRTSLEGIQLFSREGRYLPLKGETKKRLRSLLLDLADWVRAEHLPYPVFYPGGELRITLDLEGKRGEATLLRYGLATEGNEIEMEDLGEFDLQNLAESMGWGEIPHKLYLALERFPFKRDDYLLHGPTPQEWPGAEALGGNLFRWANASYGNLWDLVGIDNGEVYVKREKIPIEAEERATFPIG